MRETSFLEAVTERDIDLLVLEELHVSPRFRSWFIASVVADCPERVTFLDAWHSLSDTTIGESDLVLSFRDSAQKAWTILIENKIDAPPQPDQAARYAERGRVGVRGRRGLAGTVPPRSPFSPRLPWPGAESRRREPRTLIAETSPRTT
jgi:hypothetical protein